MPANPPNGRRSIAAWVSVCALVASALVIGCGGGGGGGTSSGSGGSSGGSSTGATTATTTGSTTSTSTSSTGGTGGSTGSASGIYVYSTDLIGGRKLFRRNASGSGGSTPIPSSAGYVDGPSLDTLATRLVYTAYEVFATIMKANADGSGESVLVSDNSDNYEPCISPDGTKVAFTSFRTGVPQIWIIDWDGSNLTQLTFLADGAVQPRFSPDGSKIVFVAGSTSDDIFVMNADGSGITQLTFGAVQENMPCFGPGGTTIYYVQDFGIPGEPVGQIMAMDSDGSNVRRLTQSNVDEADPCVSVDGGHVLFVRVAGSGREVMRMKTDGTSVSVLTAEGAWASTPRAPGR